MPTPQIDLNTISRSQTPPPLFERGAPMWHDPYIATQMLKYHLNETHDIASRKPETIDAIVSWIINHLQLKPEMRLLDLGCGPGLYTSRFAKRGLQVTGMDYSQHSITYAKEQDPATNYMYQNYVEMDFPDHSFDVVTMIYGDFCVLSNQERDQLLAKVKRMLRSGGHFVFDVTQPQMHHYIQNLNRWSIVPEGGFWNPLPHLILEQGFTYPDDIFLEQSIVIMEDGQQTLYRNWFHDYTQATLQPVLESAGFSKAEFFGDLTGIPYTEPADWCGVVVQA